MRILSMHVMKYNEENPLFMSSVYELGFIK